MKAVIWDMGGVLLRTLSQDGRRKWEEALKIPFGELERTVFSSDSGKLAGLGKITPEEHWTNVLDQYDIPSDKRSAFISDFWSGDRMDHTLVNHIRNLKTDYRSGLITNAWLDIRHMLVDVWEISDAFHEILISAEIGMAKPDPAIYHRMLEKMEVEAGESVFVDDFIENVIAAREIGMHAIHFQTPDQALNELDTLLKAG